MPKGKVHINLVFIGHVDHGKSTTVGRLLYDTKNVDEQEMRKLKDKAKELGKSGFEFAFVMDNLKEEWINKKKRRWFPSETSLITNSITSGRKMVQIFLLAKV